MLSSILIERRRGQDYLWPSRFFDFSAEKLVSYTRAGPVRKFSRANREWDRPGWTFLGQERRIPGAAW